MNFLGVNRKIKNAAIIGSVLLIYYVINLNLPKCFIIDNKVCQLLNKGNIY